ncbi:MAG: iron-containing alcohol dehydrogenase family protein [Phycisphaerae bacterium]
MMPEILGESPVRVVFGAGALGKVGALARDAGASRVLLVTDAGVSAAGHVDTAVAHLHEAGLCVTVFDGARENPTAEDIDAGVRAARPANVDFIMALGGGSAMDCAKGINLILTNGGEIRDYRGEGKATKPMLPSIAAPTTAGTGSEAQSFALISDPETHGKMACGDRRLPFEGGLRPRIAILDPDLTRTAPGRVTAAAGIDAVAHAVETAATTRRSGVSRAFSREAWRRLTSAFESVLRDQYDGDARAEMLLGAHLAGGAIERSMLGAAHACANPLTAQCGVVHGLAVGIMLPHVVRFNAADGPNPYADLDGDADRLASRLSNLLDAAGLPRRLSECGVKDSLLPVLAVLAAEQWTAGFNPRPVCSDDLLAVYRRAM